MPLVAAHEFDTNAGSTQLYNAMDSMLTAEVLGELKALLPGANAPPERHGFQLIYDFERALQAPALEMMARGWCVDPEARETGISEIRRRLERLSLIIDCYASAIAPGLRSPTKSKNSYPKPVCLNPDATKQLQTFFYEIMKIPPRIMHKAGVESRPMDRDTLEHLDKYFLARPVVQAILAYRDNAGQLEVMESQVDDDWRLRTSYNPAATTTGRWSSSESPTGAGRNLQNIEEELRYWLVASPGEKLLGADYSQVESRDTAWLCGILFGDWTLFENCESADPHVATSKLIWPNLDWTENPILDRKIADQLYYRHHTYRDIAKRARHGCLTEDHEVLTPSGWVSIIEKPDMILQFSEAKSEFVPVSNWVDSVQDTVFWAWEGSSLSARMTCDHKVLYRIDDKSSMKCSSAERVSLLKSARIPSGWGYIGGGAQISVGDARLIAAYQCDGYWNYGARSLQIDFHMQKERKFDRLQKLAAEAERHYRRSGDRAYVRIDEIATWPKRAGAYLLTWPAEAAKAYLEELIFWDGHTDKKGCSTLSSADKDHLSWIQTMNRIYGVGGNLVYHAVSGFGTPMFVLAYNNRQYTKMSSLNVAGKRCRARALCPTVPSGFFYIRRNGKISVTGNTEKGGQPPEIAKQIRVPLPLIREFQAKFFAAFPVLQKFFTWVASQIQRDRYLINAFGMRRDFFGRPDSSDTIKQAIAFMSQSPAANRTNLAIWRLWRYEPQLKLLSQQHDAIYLERDEIKTDEAESAATLCRHMNVELSFRGRRFIVPSETKVGWRWANAYKTNPDGTQTLVWPDGMKKFTGNDPRTRNGKEPQQ